MVEYIKKRDGRVVAFDRDKIYEAMNKAFTANHNPKSASVLNKLTDQVIAQMEQTFSADSIPSVEEIQDMVERVLIDNGFVLIAKDYILYRAERSRIREMNTRLMQIYDDITNKAAVRFRHQAGKRQHQRRYRHGRHAEIRHPRAPSSST